MSKKLENSNSLFEKLKTVSGSFNQLRSAKTNSTQPPPPSPKPKLNESVDENLTKNLQKSQNAPTESQHAKPLQTETINIEMASDQRLFGPTNSFFSPALHNLIMETAAQNEGFPALPTLNSVMYENVTLTSKLMPPSSSPPPLSPSLSTLMTPQFTGPNSSLSSYQPNLNQGMVSQKAVENEGYMRKESQNSVSPLFSTSGQHSVMYENVTTGSDNLKTNVSLLSSRLASLVFQNSTRITFIGEPGLKEKNITHY